MVKFMLLGMLLLVTVCSSLKSSQQISPDFKINYTGKKIGYYVAAPGYVKTENGGPTEESQPYNYLKTTTMKKVKAQKSDVINITSGKSLFDYINNYFEGELNIPINAEEASKIIKANNIDCMFIVHTGLDYSDMETDLSPQARQNLVNLGFILAGVVPAITGGSSNGYRTYPYYRAMMIYTCGDKPLYQGFARASSKDKNFGDLVEDLHNKLETSCNAAKERN